MTQVGNGTLLKPLSRVAFAWLSFSVPLNELGQGPNLHDVCATGRFLRGFPLKEPVDSKHSRQNPIIELKNRRTFTLFTTFSGRVVVGMKDERLLR